MLDKFRHDLDRPQTYMVLRALDAYIVKMQALGESKDHAAVDRAVARVEADEAQELRKKMAQGL